MYWGCSESNIGDPISVLEENNTLREDFWNFFIYHHGNKATLENNHGAEYLFYKHIRNYACCYFVNINFFKVCISFQF